MARAVDEVVAVERHSVQEAVFGLSSSARPRQVVAQVDQLAGFGPKTVSSVALDEGWAGVAEATQELGPGKAHRAAHTDWAVEAED